MSVSFTWDRRAHWEICSKLRLRLVRIEGWSAYARLLSTPEIGSGNSREGESQQLWATLQLGTPLCYLFNLIPNQPEITDVNVDPAALDKNDVEGHKVTSGLFLKALTDMRGRGEWPGGSFELPDLYHDQSELNPATIIKVSTLEIIRVFPKLFSTGRSGDFTARGSASSPGVHLPHPRPSDRAPNHHLRPSLHHRTRRTLHLTSHYSPCLPSLA